MVEFVIGAPILIVILLGVMQFGAVYHDWTALTDASRAGARTAAESRTSSSRDSDAVNAAKASASSELSTSHLTVDNPVSSWTPGATVKVCAHYPYSISIMSVAVASGNLDSCTTQLVQ